MAGCDDVLAVCSPSAADLCRRLAALGYQAYRADGPDGENLVDAAIAGTAEPPVIKFYSYRQLLDSPTALSFNFVGGGGEPYRLAAAACMGADACVNVCLDYTGVRGTVDICICDEDYGVVVPPVFEADVGVDMDFAAAMRQHAPLAGDDHVRQADAMYRTFHAHVTCRPHTPV